MMHTESDPSVPTAGAGQLAFEADAHALSPLLLAQSLRCQCSGSRSRTIRCRMPVRPAPPLVQVWLSPQMIVIRRAALMPSSGPMTCTMP